MCVSFRESFCKVSCDSIKILKVSLGRFVYSRWTKHFKEILSHWRDLWEKNTSILLLNKKNKRKVIWLAKKKKSEARTNFMPHNCLPRLSFSFNHKLYRHRCIHSECFEPPLLRAPSICQFFSLIIAIVLNAEGEISTYPRSFISY